MRSSAGSIIIAFAVIAAAIIVRSQTQVDLSTQSTGASIWFQTDGAVVGAKRLVNVRSGSGVISPVVDVGGAIEIRPTLDPLVTGIRVNVPATATDDCAQNNWAADEDAWYLCVSAGNWKRMAWTTW